MNKINEPTNPYTIASFCQREAEKKIELSLNVLSLTLDLNPFYFCHFDIRKRVNFNALTINRVVAWVPVGTARVLS